MFFLIGGLQSKTTTLEQTPWICPVCRAGQAKLKRVDQYVSLFFVPLFPIKKGVPVLICGNCKAVSAPGQVSQTVGEADKGKCSECGGVVSKDFRYCPGCGRKL